MSYADLSKQIDRVQHDLATLRAPVVERIDPVSFAEQLGYELDDWQQRVLQWNGQRLILNCARQTGKSTISSILAAHQGIYYPGSLILLISPSLRQSSELFRKIGDMLNRMQQPIELVEDNRLSCQLANRSRIVSLPSSEATIRGFSGARLIIEDEAARVGDALHYSVRPMLAVSGGQLILMSTPFGKRGHFFETWEHGGPEWERVKITAYECPRIPKAFLEEERHALGEWWFSQEYLCEFRDSVSSVFSYDAIMAAISGDVQPLFGDAEIEPSTAAVDAEIAPLWDEA